MSPRSKSTYQYRIVLLSLLCMSIACAMGSAPVPPADMDKDTAAPSIDVTSTPVFMSNAFLTDVPNDWDVPEARR